MDQPGLTIVNIKHAKNVYNNYYSISNNIYPPDISPSDTLLRKQSERLKLRYRKGNMPSLLWNDSSNDLPLEKYFVPLKVDEDHVMGRFVTGEHIQLSHMFYTKEDDGIRRKRRILIRGNPGYGKTTVIRKLAYDWATLEPVSYLQMFDTVVIISLLKLGESTIQEAVAHEMCANDMDRKILLEALEQTQLNFLLLLDGYDEAFNKDKVLQFLKIDADSDFFVKLTIVVTSRPQAANDIWKEFDRHLSILGFSKENQITYVKEILGHQEERMKSMRHKLTHNQFYSDLSNCPLMLHMFCCLESEGDPSSLNTLTGLYIQLIKLLISRYNKKHNLNISLYENGEHFCEENLIAKLGNLASSYFRVSGRSLPVTAISEVTLRRIFCNDTDFDFIIGLGILTPVEITTNGSMCLTYDFIHRTIAEFLAVFYIAKLPTTESDFELYNLDLKNNLHVICFFFGLLGEEILIRNSILQYFTNTVWKADWIYRFKQEISPKTWDTLFLRMFIKKLSCLTHNFTENAIWLPLHQHLEEIKVHINPDIDNWDAIKTVMIETIQRCKLLTSLKISLQQCSQFQVNCDNSGKALLVDIRFIMDDLNMLSSLESLKKFDIEFRNLNIINKSRDELPLQDYAQQQSVVENKVFGLKSLCVLSGKDSLQTVFWNVGKLNFMLTFKCNTHSIQYVVLLVSEEQFTIVKQQFSFPGKEIKQFAVVIESGTISHI